MRALHRTLFLVMMLGIALLPTCPVQAASTSKTPPIERGLLITPLRQFVSVNAGRSQNSSFTVANLTASPMEVSLSIKQFSVTDYTYDYQFNQPHPNWLSLSQSSVSLQPQQSRNVAYTITVPSGTRPGGQYYTLVASTTLSTRGFNSTVQAADLLYITVNGALIRTSHLQSSSIQRLVFGKQVGYSLSPVNTGNVYFFASTSAELHGLFGHTSQTSVGHILMPSKVRALTDTIPSPKLPGIYRAAYGYKLDTGGWIVEQSAYIVVLPPWFLAFVLVAILAGVKFWPHHGLRTAWHKLVSLAKRL